VINNSSFSFTVSGNGRFFGELVDLIIYTSNKATRLPSKEEAMSVLKLCAHGIININHPDAIASAEVVGFDYALAYISIPQPKYDALQKRLPGSYEASRR